MTTRKTFLGRAGSAVGLLALGPEKLWAAVRRPTLTEALEDGELHDVAYVIGRHGLDSVLVDGCLVSWRAEDQPSNGIAMKKWPFGTGGGSFVALQGRWRKEIEHNRTAVEKCNNDGQWWMYRSLSQDAPAGEVLELW